MTSISTPESSLSSRAMLCSLSISMWSARKHDPQASEEIAQRHGAQADAGRYHKVLLPKEALTEIHKIVSEARQEHYFMTLPWDDNGYRVLPAAAYMDHTEKMRALSNRFTPAVSKFSFETKVMPLPDAGDFRVALGDEEKERIKRQITAAVEASLQVASRELWQRLYEAVGHLAERLQAYKVTEQGVEHPFRDSVVTNLVKLVEVLPKLNVTGDPELERLAAQVRASLLVDPQELRKSESVRTETANAATAVAKRMAAYMAGYSVPVTTTDEGRAA